MLTYLTSDKSNPEDAETSIEKKKRKIKDDWINDPKIKIWAEKKNQKVYCKLCNTDLKASSGKTDLIAHANTKKHLDASRSVVHNQQTIDSVFTAEKYASKRAEINLALFIVEHNIPFAAADHMTKMNLQICQIKNHYAWSLEFALILK
ncbi:hypothetical protein CVS40_5798 [Lucilia cuprina]|nr:hypothetical protein CVS40_5798 [Lucilia cuprina]